MLHAARARPDLAQLWLTRAVREEISAAPGCGLWFGAPAIAFAVRAAGDHRYPAAAQQLRRALATITQRRLAAATARIDAADRPSLSEFDLVRGLTGLGAHLLQHRSDHEMADLLRSVLVYLVRLAEPLSARDHCGHEIGHEIPGWWT
ncbi:MAG: lanthionine synthetase, partial [Actinomycetes bacterium]